MEKPKIKEPDQQHQEKPEIPQPNEIKRQKSLGKPYLTDRKGIREEPIERLTIVNSIQKTGHQELRQDTRKRNKRSLKAK